MVQAMRLPKSFSFPCDSTNVYFATVTATPMMIRCVFPNAMQLCLIMKKKARIKNGINNLTEMPH